ncbi:MAG TPA: hypothetical protein VM735_08590 [Candidatus Kapabacteria bacterium]|nr:hypothetical protein [Candidatus Kapabacteria bacterium]
MHCNICLFFALAVQLVVGAASTNTPTHVALRHFSKGVNFDNYLEAPRSQDWEVRYSERNLSK